MILLSQILVGTGFILALVSVVSCIMAGGIRHNPAHTSWNRYLEWSWYFWLGYVAVALWLVGMFIVPFFK